MITFLGAALAVATLLCMALGWACYRLYTEGEVSRRIELEERKELLDELKQIKRYLSGVVDVLNDHVGGISKRLSESVKVAEAIQHHSPDLFKRCDGLAYWLHANDQFLNELYNAAAEGIDKPHRRQVHLLRKDRAGEVFQRIYEHAELPAPPGVGTAPTIERDRHEEPS